MKQEGKKIRFVNKRKDDGEYVYECLNCFTMYHNIDREQAEYDALRCCGNE